MSYSRSERYYSRSRSPSRSRSRSLSSDVDRRQRRSLSRSRSRSRSYDSDAENPGNNLYVTGLSTRITKKELERHFSSEGGTVVDCHLVVDPRTRESRGFAFVTMSTVEEAHRCIKYLDRSVLGGRVITVQKAKRSRGRTPTPGRYLGVKTVRVRRRSPSYSPYGSDYSSERDRSYSPHDRRGRDRSFSPYYRRGRERYRSRSYSRDRRSPFYGSRHRSYSRSPYSRNRYRSYSRDSRSPYGRYEHRFRRSRSYSPYYYDRRDRSYSPYSRRYRDYSPNDRYDRSPSPYERRLRSVSRSVSPRRSDRRRSPSRSVSPRSRSVRPRSRSLSASP